MPAEAVKYIGDKLCVGPVDYSFLPAVPALPGTSVLNGPVWIGTGVPLPTANCMIGPGLNPITLEVKGISNIIGVTNVTGTVNRAAILTATGASFKIGLSIKQALSAVFGLKTNASNQITTGPKTCSSFIETPAIYTQVITGATLVGCSGVPAGCKTFDIQHPSKEGWRLRYICLEGPEPGVYVRGTLKGSDTIELPYYWKDLVNPESITINLTPIGSHQELFVEKIEWGTKVKIKNSSGTSIHCYYTVFGERNVPDKLQPEYEGSSPDDYPGDNTQYIINR
jgi:hypothetical protein